MTKEEKEKLVLSLAKADVKKFMASAYELIDADDIVGVSLLKEEKPCYDELDAKTGTGPNYAFFKFNHDSMNVKRLHEDATQIFHNIYYSDSEKTSDGVETNVKEMLSDDAIINYCCLPCIVTHEPCIAIFRRETEFDSYIAALYYLIFHANVSGAEEAKLNLALMGKLIQ